MEFANNIFKFTIEMNKLILSSSPKIESSICYFLIKYFKFC